MAQGDHSHGPAGRRLNPPLERGSGAGKLLFLDCPSGIAGDMTLAALLDLGVPLSAIEQQLRALPLAGYHLERGNSAHHAIAATTLNVAVTAAPTADRTYRAIDDMIAGAPLDDGTQQRARAIFRRLAEAEAAVHGTASEAVTFHEVGAVDSIVDIVGVAAATAHLGAEIAVSPLPLGRGFVQTRHGSLPLPAPATVQCLVGVPTYGTELEVELVTPTGAAIVSALATRFERWPSLTPERVGYGAGTRHLPDRPNVMRAVLGQPLTAVSGPDRTPTHQLIEANLDDVTGELAAHAIAELLDAGALDAWASAITMKKGRPALKITALAAAPECPAVIRAMLAETSTIGVRHLPVSRSERPRHEVIVETRFGSIPVKVSTGFDIPDQVKPEFAACVDAARAHDVAARVVIAEALAVYRDRMRGDDGDSSR